MAALAITLTSACSQAEQEASVVQAIPGDPIIAEKRAACFHPDAQDQPFEFAGKRIFLIQLDGRDYQGQRFPFNNPGRLSSKLITKDYDVADTLMFWDYSAKEVGYYASAGAKAYSVHLNFCLVGRATNDTSLFTVSAAPYRVAKLSSGGFVLRRTEVYAYADEWLNAKFAQKPAPEAPQQLRASIWQPCRPLADQLDDNLQRYEPLTPEEVKRSCYERLQEGWGSYQHIPHTENDIVPEKP